VRGTGCRRHNFTEPHSTVGATTQARGTLYDISGTIIGYETVHASFHVSMVDGAPVIEFHRFRLGCR